MKDGHSHNYILVAFMSLSSEILTVTILFFVILIFKPHGTIFKRKARLGLLLANANSGYLA